MKVHYALQGRHRCKTVFGLSPGLPTCASLFWACRAWTECEAWSIVGRPADLQPTCMQMHQSSMLNLQPGMQAERLQACSVNAHLASCAFRLLPTSHSGGAGLAGHCRFYPPQAVGPETAKAAMQSCQSVQHRVLVSAANETLVVCPACFRKACWTACLTLRVLPSELCSAGQ